MVLGGFQLDLDATVWWHTSGYLLRNAAFFLDRLLWRTSHGKSHFPVFPNNGIQRECLETIWCRTRLNELVVTSYWISCHTQNDMSFTELHGIMHFCCVFPPLKDQTERNRFSVYWKQVGPIVFGSFCLFIFDMCERWVNAELSSLWHEVTHFGFHVWFPTRVLKYCCVLFNKNALHLFPS